MSHATKGAFGMTRDGKIAKTMLAYSNCAGYQKIASSPDLSGWGLSAEAVKLIENDPNAFFIAVLFDRMLPWEKAWEAPFRLKKRLKHLDVRKISRMKKESLAKVIGKGSSQKALVRFPNRMAEDLVSACGVLVRDYEGDARNIWRRASAEEVIHRLIKFKGISQKIANMTARFLGTYYGVPLSDWEKIDIPVDRHVARLFLRAGLVKPTGGGPVQRISSLKQAVVQKARSLSPRFPGALDEPAFEIGRYWCTSEQAYCDHEPEPCPLRDICPRLTHLNVK